MRNVLPSSSASASRPRMRGATSDSASANAIPGGDAGSRATTARTNGGSSNAGTLREADAEGASTCTIGQAAFPRAT